jgi:hypothetical protein
MALKKGYRITFQDNFKPVMKQQHPIVTQLQHTVSGSYWEKGSAFQITFAVLKCLCNDTPGMHYNQEQTPINKCTEGA